MSTEKRERQRENRRLRRAADEAAAKQYATRRRVKLIGMAAVAVAAALAVLGFLQQRNNSEPEPAVEPAAESTADPAAEPATESTAGACPAADGSSPRTIDFDGPQPMCIDPEAGYVAVFDTSEGEMRFELTASETPLTVNNFVTLARWGYYDGTLLFRTDPSIDIIQGGSPHTNDNRDPGPGYTIPDEPAFEVDPDTGDLTGPYRYQPGQLVMARSAGQDSASAQIFLTTGPNASRLDGQGTYVVFGQTDDAGLAVAQSIIGLHEPGGPLGGAPSRDVTVRSVTIEET
ncbi:MAG: peptidylprolyl isomerase [Acidimicrobiaceae bacterium]|nr:peptidylprolyl isomerase [Acidimicrobiaceae bacterium]